MPWKPPTGLSPRTWAAARDSALSVVINIKRVRQAPGCVHREEAAVLRGHRRLGLTCIYRFQPVERTDCQLLLLDIITSRFPANKAGYSIRPQQPCCPFYTVNTWKCWDWLGTLDLAMRIVLNGRHWPWKLGSQEGPRKVIAFQFLRIVLLGKSGSAISQLWTSQVELKAQD